MFCTISPFLHCIRHVAWDTYLLPVANINRWGSDRVALPTLGAARQRYLLSNDYTPGTLHPRHVLLALTTGPQGRCYPHITDVETEAQKG